MWRYQERKDRILNWLGEFLIKAVCVTGWVAFLFLVGVSLVLAAMLIAHLMNYVGDPIGVYTLKLIQFWDSILHYYLPR